VEDNIKIDLLRLSQVLRIGCSHWGRTDHIRKHGI